MACEDWRNIRFLCLLPLLHVLYYCFSFLQWTKGIWNSQLPAGHPWHGILLLVARDGSWITLAKYLHANGWIPVLFESSMIHLLTDL